MQILDVDGFPDKVFLRRAEKNPSQSLSLPQILVVISWQGSVYQIRVEKTSAIGSKLVSILSLKMMVSYQQYVFGRGTCLYRHDRASSLIKSVR